MAVDGKLGFVLGLFLLVQQVGGSSFFVSFHGGDASDPSNVNNVYEFDVASGALVRKNVLEESYPFRELRGMLVWNGALLVANSYTGDSRLFRVGNEGLGDVVTFTTANLAHPYGLAVCATKAVLYVSNQDSNLVTQYDLNTGKPVGSGVFAKVPNPRGVACDVYGNVFVASVDANAVFQYDSQGNQAYSLSVSHPTGVAVANGTVFISSDDSNNPAVYSFEVATGKPLNVFTTPHGGLDHPAGLAVYGEDLYVLGQDKLQLLHFKAFTGEYIGKLIENLPDAPEAVIVVP